MSFTARLALVCSLLAALVAALVLGIVFSPERVAERSAGAPLVPLARSAAVLGVDVYSRASDRNPLVTLKRTGPNQWQALSGSVSYPASADRVAALLQGLHELRRGNLVTRDPARRTELGLDDNAARMVVLHVAGRPDIALLVGKRAASGDEEYVMARGEPSAWLARSGIGILLDQDLPYWYDLRVLPEDIRGDTILSVAVDGSVRLGPQGSLGGSYTLVHGRSAQGQPEEWRIGDSAGPVNTLAAATMMDRVARLEGIDFTQASPPRRAGGMLTVTVVAINGDRYILRVTASGEPGKLFLTTSWSPWTYVVDSPTLSRTIFPLSALRAP